MLVNIHRKNETTRQYVSEDSSEKLTEEFMKLQTKYNELFDSSIHLREQINQNIQKNKSLLLDHHKYRTEFSDNAKKCLLYFYLRTKYIDGDLIEESTKIIHQERKNFDPDETYDLKDNCSSLPSLLIKHLTNIIFFTYPPSEFVQKSINVVIKAVERKVLKNCSTESLRKVRKYLLNNKEDSSINKIEQFEEIEHIKATVDELFEIVFNEYDNVFGRIFEKEETTLTGELGNINCTSDGQSVEASFSIRTLKNLLVLDNYDLVMSSTPSLN